MLEFAVQVRGEDIGRWVLAVDPVGDRLLITSDDRTLRWVDIADCKFLKARNLDIPLPVVITQLCPHQTYWLGSVLQDGPNGRAL